MASSVTGTAELTARQEEALDRLRRLRLPAPPPLSAVRLVPPPAWYRFEPLGLWAAPAVLLCLLVSPFLKVPDTWAGAVPLKSGSVVQLLTAGRQTIRLPDDQGALILEGPATLEFARLRRRLISGRMEGDLRLKEGQLLFQAGPALLKSIQIQTPLLTVRVKGTRFLIGHGFDRGSRLQVLEGTVWVKPAGSGNRWGEVRAGAELTVTPGGTVQTRALPKPEAEETAATHSVVGMGGAEPGTAQSSSHASPSSGTLWREQE